MSEIQITLGDEVETVTLPYAPYSDNFQTLIKAGTIFNEGNWAMSNNEEFILFLSAKSEPDQARLGEIGIYQLVGPNPTPSSGVSLTVQKIWSQGNLEEEQVNLSQRGANWVYTFSVQIDGNLVLISDDGTQNIVWASHTKCDGWLTNGAFLQNDGNLVLFKLYTNKVWASGI